MTEKQWQDFIKNLEAQGLSREDIQSRINQKQKDIDAGKDPGVANQAAPVTPKIPAASTALESETPSSELSLDQKLNALRTINPNIPPTGIVDAFGNFASTVFDMGEGLASIPSSAILGAEGALRNFAGVEFGPEARKKRLEQLDNVSYFGSPAMKAAVSLGSSIANKVVGDENKEIPKLGSASFFGSASDFLKNNLTKDYQEKYGMTSITEAIEKGEYGIASEMAVSASAASAPYTIASMFGPWGLVAMGGATGGQKFREEIESENGSSLGSIITNAGMTGTNEAMFDRFTMGLFRQAKGVVGVEGIKAARDIMKQGTLPFIKQLLKGSGKVAKSAGGEGITESLTELTNAFIDTATFNEDIKWKDIKYNVIDAGILGTFTGGTIQTFTEVAPNNSEVRRRAEELLMSDVDKVKINRITAKVLTNLELLQSEDLSLTQRNLLNKENKNLANESFQITKENVIKLNSMNAAELNNYSNNLVGQREIIEQRSIKGLDESTLKELEGNYKILADDNIDIQNKAVERKGQEMYEEFASTLEGAKGIQNLLNVKIKRFNEEEYSKYVDPKIKSGELSSDYAADGRVNAFFNSDTNEIILPDFKIKDKKGMAAFYSAVTPTHETMHAVVKKIINTPDLQNKFGKELLGYLNEIGSGYFENTGKGGKDMSLYREETDKAKRPFKKRVTKEYLKGELNTEQANKLAGDIDFAFNATLAEEAIARTSDAIYYGLIKENTGPLSKINNLFRRMSQELLGTELAFDTNKDVFNFIKDINTDLKRGRLSWGMRKTLMKDASGKLAAETYGNTRDLKGLEDFLGQEHKAFMEDDTAENIREMFRQYQLKTKKGLTTDQERGGAMTVATMFKKIVAKKLQSHDWRPDFQQFKDIILDGFILDEKRGITNLIIKHAKSGLGGNVDGYVNRYFPDRLHKYVDKFLQPIKKDDEGVAENAGFMAMLKRDSEEAGPDPSEIEEQINYDKENFKINVIDKLNLPGNLGIDVQGMVAKSIVLNVKALKKEAGREFRNQFKKDMRKTLSTNGSSLDVALKGEKGLNKQKRIAQFEKFVTDHAKALYETLTVEDFLAMKASGAPFITKLKDATGKTRRTDVNYAQYHSYAGNVAAKKKPYSQVEKTWAKHYILQEGEVDGTSEYRTKTETRYRSLRDILADKIGADQLNDLIKTDTKFKELLELQESSLTEETIDALKRNLKQGQFAFLENKEAADYFEQNPETILDILSGANNIENDVIINGMPLGKAIAVNNPNISADDAAMLENAFTMHHIKASRDHDTGKRAAETKKYKSTSPSKRVSDMVDSKSGRSKSIKSADAEDRARALGAKISFYKKTFSGDIFLPYTAEDFEGLLYNLYRNGKVGEQDQKFFDENIIMPYFAATRAIDKERLIVSGKLKQLKKDFEKIPNVKLDSPVEGLDGLYTAEQAVRMWNMSQSFTQEKIKQQTGVEIGIQKILKKYVEDNPAVEIFAKKVQSVTGMDGYPMLDGSWRQGTIAFDIVEVMNETRRKRYLSDWNDKMANTFTPKVRNKMLAEFGQEFMNNFDQTINRMNSGRSTASTSKSDWTGFLNWVNKSQATIMFFNGRSAVLQTISSVNFVNTTDNNPLAAGKAFANVPQLWDDINMILKSDFIKARKEGTTINVIEEDFIREVNSKKGMDSKYNAAVGYLLDNGYTFTRAADALAIAVGGATFYRNRLNSLIKQGVKKEKAEEQAFEQFRVIALKTQQSSDQALISNVQASEFGRTLYAFANTPFQYSRLMKKSARDLISGRGDPKAHMGRIMYYGFIQNATFNIMQSALLSILSDHNDDDEEFVEEKANRVVNGMISSILRGSGKYGLLLDVARSVNVELGKERKKDEYMQDNFDAAIRGLLDVSPPLDHKYRKMRKAFDPLKYNEEGGYYAKQKYTSTFPVWTEVAANGLELANIPADRVLQKLENLNSSFYQPDIDMMSRIALANGWSEWDLGIEDPIGMFNTAPFARKTSKTGKIEGPINVDENNIIDTDENNIIDVNE